MTGFRPFDPVAKRAEADIEQDGKTFKVAKGAPQVIVDLCAPDAGDASGDYGSVERYGAKGFRTLGVARADGGAEWRFLGLLPLFDPPRDDCKETIKTTRAMGVNIKMVTGDHEAIAREIAGQLDLGRNIVVADTVFTDGSPADKLAKIIAADGFARVFPEHKFEIVKALQGTGRIVGMTGDGVNDAPALRQADVGIAVSGATDAARAAAALVLTAPGLSVITTAIEEARRIFERMTGYAIYRIAETMRLLLFHDGRHPDFQFLSGHRDHGGAAGALERYPHHDDRLRQRAFRAPPGRHGTCSGCSPSRRLSASMACSRASSSIGLRGIILGYPLRFSRRPYSSSCWSRAT